MKKRADKKLELVLILIVVIQGALLINMIPANSYLIGQSNNLIENNIARENLNNDDEPSLNFGLSLLIGFLSIKQIGSVSAQEDPFANLEWNCCTKTVEGAICQEISSENPGLCDPEHQLIPTQCEFVADCKVGCCYDEEEGICTTNAPQGSCTEAGGMWRDDESCQIKEANGVDCIKGCCVLGPNTEFVTEKRCERIAELDGRDKDFRDLRTEIECLALQETQDIGACLLNAGDCSFTTELECIAMTGQFRNQSLCSNPDLDTNCEKSSSVGCLEDDDEIYWLDSCGNRENIYDSNEELSWNNGMILSKDSSCNPESTNIGSETCGNCNYYLGSMCGESGILENQIKDGAYVCQSMNCIDDVGREWNNGESWCVYDSYIGDGKDAVGSRQWRRMCIDGEIKVEPCGDYRGQLCVQSEVDINKTLETFTVSSCAMNEALNCVSYNSYLEMETLCEDNTDCMIKSINVDDGFMFNFCVGKYPKGFDLTGEEKIAEAESMCNMASLDCTMIEEKKVDGDWECEFNCDCDSMEFTRQMNDLCVSVGDCGSYINYIGDGTDNIRVTRAPYVHWQDYIRYADAVEGQFVEPRNIRELLDAILGAPTNEGYEMTPSEIAETVQLMGSVTGGIGTALYVGTLVYGTFIMEGSFGLAFAGDLNVMLLMTETLGPNLAGFVSFAKGIGLAVGAAAIISMAFGLQGDAAMVMAVAGVAVGIGTIVVMEAATGCAATGPAAAICVGILIIVAIVLKLLGIGDTRERVVEFDCEVWQPPTGGDNCERCNDDPLRPCSEYRCTSLGLACGFINPDSEDPKCVEIASNDGIPPVISPGYIEGGYEFMNDEENIVEVRDPTGKCIPEFTNVRFALETDEYSQCKYDWERVDDYNNKQNYFLEGSYYKQNHTMDFSMPSLSSLEVHDLVGDIREEFGDLNMYVRCEDWHGNTNSVDYVVNLCVRTGVDYSPAYLKDYSPSNGSYIEYGGTEFEVTFALNEPAECNYDFVDEDYFSMGNSMTCDTEVYAISENRWDCLANMTNLDRGTNNMYIKCRDQPWLGPDNMSRNINVESFRYTIYNSQGPLVIDDVSPQGEITGGFEPVSVDLVAHTSGGAKGDGEATCYYDFRNYETMARFLNTFSTEHRQNFNSMMGGDFNIYVECEDIGGNTERDISSFRLQIDDEPPEVSRVYNQGGQLKIVTNEDAECYYDIDSCHFELDDGISMTPSLSTMHNAEWNENMFYHIRCKDLWGNTPDGCTIKVFPDRFA